MPIQARPSRVAAAITLTVGVVGCAGEHPQSGRRILEGLERNRIPLPVEVGRASTATPHAELPSAGPVALADLLRVAEARSPGLAAARSSVGIAAGQAWQASLYPNPSVDVTSENMTWRQGTSGTKTTVGVTQPIVLGDRLRAARKAGEAEQAARLAEVEARRRSLFGDVALLHSRLIAIRDQERLYSELRDLINKTLTAAQTRFEAKAAPETDVIRPRVELYRADAALGRLRQEGLATARDLGLLLGDIPIEPDRLDGSVPMLAEALDVLALERALRSTHPALVVADREVDAAEARLQRVQAEKTPDLDVRVGTGYNAELDSGVVDVGVGMTIPLWDAREGDALAARFELMRARQERAGIENELLRRLTSAVGEFEAAKAQLDTFRDKVVPGAQRSFDQTTEGYRGGRSSFLDLLDAQRTLTESRVTVTELASAVMAARAKVIQIVGPDGLSSQAGAPEASPSVIPFPIQERPQGAEVKP
jgi:cobalt-zinc-cadmium efflux system outer membrane protein